MALLTDLINLNLTETTEKVIAEYIWYLLLCFFRYYGTLHLCMAGFLLLRFFGFPDFLDVDCAEQDWWVWYGYEKQSQGRFLVQKIHDLLLLSNGFSCGCYWSLIFPLSDKQTLPGPVADPSDLPKWNFDGSSTGQAPGDDSEVIIW